MKTFLTPTGWDADFAVAETVKSVHRQVSPETTMGYLAGMRVSAVCQLSISERLSWMGLGQGDRGINQECFLKCACAYM